MNKLEMSDSPTKTTYSEIGKLLKPVMCVMGVVYLLIFLIVDQTFLSSARGLNSATTIVVNTLEDEMNNDGNCSLREAITAANLNITSDACLAGTSDIDTITFDVTGTITLTSKLPDILNAGALVIDGGGDVTISGNHAVRVFYINNGANLTLQDITISDGYVTCCSPIGEYLGGGGLSNKGTVTISNSTFTHNVAHGSGGGVFNDSGTIYITNSHFSENISDYGGAISGSRGTMSIDSSTFYSNSNRTLNSGYGGAINSSSTLNVTDSTFYDNKTFSNGGAFWITADSNAVISNTTFTNNNAFGLYGQGGAIASDNNSIVTIINSTLYNNLATVTGTAIHKGTGTISIRNSIVANNFTGVNCFGIITDGGHNIDSGNSCGFDSGNGSMQNTNPQLVSLFDNGGPTFTHALLQGSPVINQANPNDCSEYDQRGASRMGQCDIGAYEYGGTLLEVYSSSNPSLVGDTLIFTATIREGELTLPTGNIVFYADGVIIGTQPLNASGLATYTTNTLSAGTHVITASYTGDSNFASSTGRLSPDQIVMFAAYLPLVIR